MYCNFFYRKIPNITLFILLPGICIFLAMSGCKPSPPARPNILLAVADDWGWSHAGVYGDPVVLTPAFDRVAEEGILFDQAYVTSPSCTPSRNGILTGQYHWRLGPGANLWSTLDTAIPVFPLLLEDAGYTIGQQGKSWGPGDISNWRRHPAGKEYSEGGFKRFLEEWTGEEPFFFWLGSSDPHRPYVEGSGAASGMEVMRIRLYGCFPDNEIVRNDVADYYYEVQRFDTLVAGALKLLEERGVLENTIVVVTGDNGIPFPRCKSNNYDAGVRVPLAIRWGGIPHRGRELEDLVSLTDLAPTFLELAGVEVPGAMTGRSLVPLLNSASSALADPDHRSFVLHGKERHVPAQESHPGGYPVRAIRTQDYLYIRNFEPDWWPAGTPCYEQAYIPYCWLGDCDNGPTKSYMVEHRQDDELHQRLYDLAFGKRPAEELYDCRNDPEQLRNLAGDPAFEAVRSRLSAQLMEELKRTGDPRVLEGKDLWDGVPYLGHGPRHPSFEQENP
jgi:arylsulfatase A-like enzyme